MTDSIRLQSHNDEASYDTRNDALADFRKAVTSDPESVREAIKLLARYDMWLELNYEVVDPDTADNETIRHVHAAYLAQASL